MSDPHASEVPGDAVPRFDAGIAFVIAALAPVGAVAAAAAIPCAAFLMAWSLGSAFAFGGWRDIGSIRPQLAVVSLILGAGCALLAAPLLRALTMPGDRL